MEIKSTLTNRLGQTLGVVYCEGDLSQDLDGKILQTVHAYCFYKGKLVVYAENKKYWLYCLKQVVVRAHYPKLAEKLAQAKNAWDSASGDLKQFINAIIRE